MSKHKRTIIRGNFVTHNRLDCGVGRVAHEQAPGLVWVAWIVNTGKWGAGLYKATELTLVGLPQPNQPTLGIDESDGGSKWKDLKKYTPL